MSTAAYFESDLKEELLMETRLVRNIRRGVGIELERIERAVLKRGMSADLAMNYAKRQLEDYFAAELIARRVS